MFDGCGMGSAIDKNIWVGESLNTFSFESQHLLSESVFLSDS